MRAILLNDAQADFEEIFDYLEGVQLGLGRRLYAEILHAMDRIEMFPRSYAKVY